jgi:hypothetical protein
VTKTGNTYTLNLAGKEQIKMGVGRENAKKYLYDHKSELEQAKKEILEVFKKRLKEGRLEVENYNKDNNSEEIDDSKIAEMESED